MWIVVSMDSLSMKFLNLLEPSDWPHNLQEHYGHDIFAPFHLNPLQSFQNAPHYKSMTLTHGEAGEAGEAKSSFLHRTPSEMAMDIPEHTAEVAIDIPSDIGPAVVEAETTASDELFVTPNGSTTGSPVSPSASTVDPAETTNLTVPDCLPSTPKSPQDSRKRSRSETPPVMDRSTVDTEATPETNQALPPSSLKRESKHIRAKSPGFPIPTTTNIESTALVTTKPPETTTTTPLTFTISPIQDRATAIKSARQAIAAPDNLSSGRLQLVYFVDAARNQSYSDSRPLATRQGARPGSYAVVSKDFGSDVPRWSTPAYDILNCHSVEQALKMAICEAMGHALEIIELTDDLMQEGCHIVIFVENVSCVEHLGEVEDPEAIDNSEEGKVVVNVGGSNDVKDYLYGRAGPRGFQRYITRPIDYAITETVKDLIASGSEWELRDKIRRSVSRVSVEIRWIHRGVICQQILADDLARSVNMEEGGVLLFKRCLATSGLDDGVALAVAEWRMLRDEDRRRNMDVGRFIQLQELESEHGWLGLTLEESSEMRDLERRVGPLVDCGRYEGLKSPDYGMEWLTRV